MLAIFSKVINAIINIPTLAKAMMDSYVTMGSPPL